MEYAYREAPLSALLYSAFSLGEIDRHIVQWLCSVAKFRELVTILQDLACARLQARIGRIKPCLWHYVSIELQGPQLFLP